MNGEQDEAEELRRKIAEIRVVVLFRGAVDVSPRTPPPNVHGEIERLRWQLEDIQWRRDCLTRRH
ncbi:hypothetical protein HNR23_003403 [Nocardiopsis mwathae]|uniref:Uncharacterized protein n=1 Tax=Nocardiopsis mwathae TaxID=1472723 RepID=A0A7X0D6I6_9ACTN|nr:hypothetical protein [Nocardiopsis mwathae]MBB6172317.1 hypothetical protein [Nocardiopsis mwathae]MBB6173343.1 hypothetical protein [Nocardiopsis mwathae]